MLLSFNSPIFSNEMNRTRYNEFLSGKNKQLFKMSKDYFLKITKKL